MTVSVFEHPFLSALLGDDEIAAFFSAKADVAAMVAFERALTAAERSAGLVADVDADAILATLDTFAPDMARLAASTATDGVVVPEFIAQLRAAVGGVASDRVHLGATSQDVIDTSLLIRLKGAFGVLVNRLDAVVAALDALAARDGATSLNGHTRMQVARPITVAHKLDNWRAPLRRHRARLDVMLPAALALQFGGAVGNRAELGDKAQAVADAMADSLGLPRSGRARHTDRDFIADLAHWCSLVTGSLGKLGQDVALMAQNEVAQVALASGGRSSAMPGKANPVPAEILVTLARFNSTLVAGIHSALVHENERSGAAWTLEWMILPQMVVATGAALRTAKGLVTGLRFLPAG